MRQEAKRLDLSRHQLGEVLGDVLLVSLIGTTSNFNELGITPQTLNLYGRKNEL